MSVIEEDMPVKTKKKKQSRTERLQYARSDSSKEMLINSVQIPSKKINIGAMLEAIYSQIYREETRPDEGSGRISALTEDDQLDEISVEQFQMSAKAYLDQMSTERKFISKEWEHSESRPFSDALEILKLNGNLWDNIKFQYGHSSRESHASPSDVLKRKSKNTKYSEKVSCNCSLLQSHHSLSSKVPNDNSLSQSFTEMKRKLKCSFGRTRKKPYQTLVGVTTLEPLSSKLTSKDDSACQGMDIGNSATTFTSAKLKDKNQGLQSSCGPENSCRNKSCIELNIPSVRSPKKNKYEVVPEAKKRLSARLSYLNAVKTPIRLRSPTTLEQILSSPEQDFWPFSPRKETGNSSVTAQMIFNPYNSSPPATKRNCQMQKGKQKAYASPLVHNEESKPFDDSRKYNSVPDIFDPDTNFPLNERSNVEVRENIACVMVDPTANGPCAAKIVGLESTQNPGIIISALEGPGEVSSYDANSIMQKTNKIELLEEDGNVVQLRLDSTSPLDDSPWTPLSMCRVHESMKDREEYPSPVSVLEPFFTEDINSPPSQRAGGRLKPRRLYFEECSSEVSPIVSATIWTTDTDEKDTLSCYVNAVLQASRLDWDNLSENMLPTEQLIHESLFYEVEFPSTHSPYDPKLLFDHINEILLEIHPRHFSLTPWTLSVNRRKIQFARLEQQVFDELMKESEFYLHPRTERRTLDQLVGKDVANSRSWLDIRLDTVEIVIQISEYVLEESILHLLLDFDT